ncbi:MAG: GntR family transcriptional regulator [Phycisphaeraceae bacterium]|nr:GntR family transcriptional regulator [Phycisphaeraceae bacterium]
MTIQIVIQSGQAASIHRQIVDQVRLAAALGRLPAGEQMPSVRGLAEQLVVNPNTVARAYLELTREGVLVSQPGRGLFVAEARQVYTQAERKRRVEPLAQSLVREAVALGLTAQQIHELIDQQFRQVEKK